MAGIYEEFENSNDLEENDDEIGALGSILSWDDDEENGPSNGLTASSLLASVRESSAPPDMVQFKDNGSLSEYNFFQDNKDSKSSMTLQLPMPTPVGDMQQQSTATSMPMQQFVIPAQEGMTANQLAQLLAQHASNLLQQSGVQHQQAQAPNQPQQVQQQQQAQQQAQQAQQQQVTQMMQRLVQQQQQQQRPQQPQQIPQPQQVQPQQQQMSQQLQLPFGTDPNAFLQQLQFAQLQQQFQAAQAQAAAQASTQATVQAQATQPEQHLQQQSAPNQAVSVQTSAALKEQLRLQFTRAQNQSMPAPPPAAAASSKTAKPPRAKKTRAPAAKKPPPVAKKSDAKAAKTFGDATSSTGIVSASDTDGEASRRAKKARLAAAAAAASADDDDEEEEDEIDTSSMTAEEKAKANRDRNREHARNTRLRKKAYLEKLKTTVDDLCRERDTLVSERSGAANLLVEMHNTRTEVLMSFFALRSTNEKRRKLWSSILDESCFACVMPVTPYRSFPASELQVSKCQRTILGIDGMMADTGSLHVLFDSLVDRSKCPLGKIEFRYTLVSEDSVVAGNQRMARWVMTTTNAVKMGAKMEVSKQGMLCCRFNSSHKIVGLELMFDVMAFMLQLKQAAGTDGFSVIPNTVQTCQRTFDKPVVMTLADPPYTIIQVNKLWEEMTGYTAEQVVGKASCGILQGNKTDRKKVEEMMQEVRFKRPVSSIMLNFKKSGDVFRNFLLLYPLSTDSRITHYLGITDHVDDGTPVGPQIQPSEQPRVTQQTTSAPGFSLQPQVTSSQTPMPPVVFAGLPAAATGLNAGQNGQMPFAPQVAISGQLSMPPSTSQQTIRTLKRPHDTTGV